MGARGPLPDVLKIPGPTGSGINFPKGAPAAPKHLSAEAKRHWKPLVATLLEAGVVSPHMWPTVWAFAEALAALAKITRTVNKAKLFYSTGKGLHRVQCVHPAVKAQQAALQRVKEFAECFGLTAAKCTRVALPNFSRDRAAAAVPADAKPAVFSRKR